MASSHLDNSKLIVSGDGALSAVAVHYSVSRLDWKKKRQFIVH